MSGSKYRTISCSDSNDRFCVIDGVLTLKPDTLFELAFEVYMVGVDDTLAAGSMQDGANLTEFTGYIEWVTRGQPAISIGWDWEFQNGYFRLDGKPSINFNLQDQQGSILPPQESDLMLEKRIEQLNWAHHLLKRNWQEEMICK
ncbi:DUF4902 domain-containing protein [Vibrio sp. SCSIO 43136]|uniref:DUF4902 domain-containing protein n=1 Tax=Vibrio sp. SCSIO 43136 TaxID=2819101 RepID=UPI00207594F6|nr:DUF4902 domain-containing protein [Vibrio sp. SCSIO 43136]USD67215.1 DUF4902 domain-containing protein [Vibrio sp. SCSIO 43136]